MLTLRLGRNTKMLKDERPDNKFGPRYSIKGTNNRLLKINRNYPSDAPKEDTNRYHVLLNEIGTSFTEEQMLEFFAAFLAVRDSYEA